MKWEIYQVADCCDLRFHTNSDECDLLAEYAFKANGWQFIVGTGLDTDGATIPRTLLGVVGDRYDKLNVFPAVIHDACYTHDLFVLQPPVDWTPLHPDFWERIPVYLEAADADGLFKAVRGHLGGSTLKNWFMWAGIRYNSGIANRYPTFAEFQKKYPQGKRFTGTGVV